MYLPKKALAALLCLAAGTFARPEWALALEGKIETIVIQTHASDAATSIQLKPDGLIIISPSGNDGALKIEVLDHKNRVSKIFSLPGERLLENMQSRARVIDRTANKNTAALSLFFPTVIGGGQLLSAFLQDVLEADNTVLCFTVWPVIGLGIKALIETIETAYHGSCTKNFSNVLIGAVQSMKTGENANLVLKTKLGAKEVIKRMEYEMERI